MQLFFWFALILYIPLNHTSISSFPYIYNIIAIRPKLTTPQISFQIRLPLKQFPRYYAFKHPNNLTRCNFRMCRTKHNQGHTTRVRYRITNPKTGVTIN